MSAAPCKVLVVDDDANCAEELCLLLAAVGIQTSSAHCAADGIIKFLDDANIRVVVSDIRMPDCDGLEFLEMIRLCRERGGGAGFILVTGHPERHTAVDALKLGVSAVLLKPLDPINVVDTVSRAVALQTVSSSRSADRARTAESSCSVRKATPIDDILLDDVLAALKKILRDEGRG